MIRKSGYRLSEKFMSAAFDNPDHVAIVIHNYRWRLTPRRRRGVIDADRDRPSDRTSPAR